MNGVNIIAETAKELPILQLDVVVCENYQSVNAVTIFCFTNQKVPVGMCLILKGFCHGVSQHYR